MAFLQIIREIGRVGVNEFCDSGECTPISEEERDRIYNLANDPISKAFVSDLQIKISCSFHIDTIENTRFSIGNGAEIDVSKLITEHAQHFKQCSFYEAIAQGKTDPQVLFNAVMNDMQNGLYPISGQQFMQYTGCSDLRQLLVGVHNPLLLIKPNVYSAIRLSSRYSQLRLNK